MIKTTKKKFFLIVAIIWNLLILIIFKYLNFLIANLNITFSREIIPQTNIKLPIGISFFTFQILSYVIDVYRNNVQPQKSLYKLSLYAMLFPQLIAGPIVRYASIEEEIDSRKISREDIVLGIQRFILGLAKKVLLANYLAIVADNIFNLRGIGAEVSILTSWAGIIAYTFQIYFDFSGYSDMAIGLGLLFGFHFEENFNFPYIAKSVTDFWRRWHISLSLWFRDYVYIPMGGNRCSKVRWLLNFFTVWLLTGIWHGANWTFIFWGIYYFILLFIEKNFIKIEKDNLLSRSCTFFFIMVGWIFFRANSLTDAFLYIKNLFYGTFIDDYFIDLIKNGYLLTVFISFMVVVTPIRKLFYSKRSMNVVSLICYFILFVISLVLCVKATYNPFIYFNF